MAKTKAVATSKIDKKQEKQIAKIFKKLARIEPETKWAEYTNTSATATYSGTLVSFNTGLSQGTGDFGYRIGDSLTMKSLRLRIQPQTYNYNVSVNYRIILFQLLNDPDGALSNASIPNLLLHDAQVGTVLAPSAPYDHDNRKSFKILYDKNFKFNPQTLTTANVNPGETRLHKINISFKKSRTAKVQYFAAGTTTTQNELFMLVITDSSATLAIPYVAHLYYTDA